MAQREQARRDATLLNALYTLAARTLAGEFGAEPKELASRLLLNEKGQCARDLRVLRGCPRVRSSSMVGGRFGQQILTDPRKAKRCYDGGSFDSFPLGRMRRPSIVMSHAIPLRRSSSP